MSNLVNTGDSGQLRFDQTVDRALVHREAVHEVLLTDSIKAAEDRFLVACQVGRSHPLFGDRTAPFHDLLMVLEAARQATVLVSHKYLRVPFDWGFIANAMTAENVDLDAWRDRGRPAEAVIEMRTSDTKYRGDTPSGLSFDIDIAVDGTRAATMNGALMFMPKADYAVLREHVRSEKPAPAGQPQPPRRLAPALVGRHNPRNVVLGEPAEPGSARFPVLVDQTHPSLFDHELDHLPAIYLLEVFRQAATAAARAQRPDADLVLRRCVSSFTSFVELDRAVQCVATVTGSVDTGPDTGLAVHVAVEQDGKVVSQADLDLVVVG